MAIKKGILEKGSPVLDFGCGDLYAGLFGVLTSVLWTGTYVGLDDDLPSSRLAEWEKRGAGPGQTVLVHETKIDLDVGDELPLPPVDKHPLKQVAVAFAVNTLSRCVNRARVVQDLKRVASSVVVVGGCDTTDLDAWEFQQVGEHYGREDPEAWGIWFDHRAESYYRRRAAFPESVSGYFATEKGGRDAFFGQQLGVCQYCGQIDFTAKSQFGCAKCGKPNAVRRKA